MTLLDRRSVWIVCAAALLLAGCADLNGSYVQADRLTHDAVAPEYRRYVERDAALDEEQQERRLRTLDAWAQRLETAERELGGGAP